MSGLDVNESYESDETVKRTIFLHHRLRRSSRSLRAVSAW